MSNEYGRRCTRFFAGVWDYAQISSDDFRMLCGFPAEQDLTFWRLLRGQSDYKWTPALAEQIAHASLPWIRVPLSEVCEYLAGSPVKNADRLREIEWSRFWWPQPGMAQALGTKLQEHEQGAKLITGIQRGFAASQMQANVYKPFYQNITAGWGKFGRRARSVMYDFGETRYRKFYSQGGYGAVKSRVLFFLSGFKPATEMKGPYSGVDPSAMHNCLTLLIEEVILRMNCDLILIDDRIMPKHIIKHYSEHDAVVTSDNRFATKLYRGTLRRSWCERQEGTGRATYIDRELKMVEELLKYRTHELSKTAMAEAFRKFLPEDR